MEITGKLLLEVKNALEIPSFSIKDFGFGLSEVKEVLDKINGWEGKEEKRIKFLNYVLQYQEIVDRDLYEFLLSGLGIDEEDLLLRSIVNPRNIFLENKVKKKLRELKFEVKRGFIIRGFICHNPIQSTLIGTRKEIIRSSLNESLHHSRYRKIFSSSSQLKLYEILLNLRKARYIDFMKYSSTTLYNEIEIGFECNIKNSDAVLERKEVPLWRKI